MSLLLPWGLLLGTGALVIVGLYLLKPRRKTVVVSSVLPFASHRRDASPISPWQRLRTNPLLLLQVLAALLLALLLARPRLTNFAAGSENAVLLVVDNSLSMAAREGRATRLSLARKKAEAYLATLPGGVAVTLALSSPRPVQLTPAIRFLPRVRQSIRDIPQSLASAPMDELGDFLARWANGKKVRVVIFSDGAKNGVLKTPKNIRLAWIAVGRPALNRALAEAQITPAGQQGVYRLAARVVSPGWADPFEATLRVGTQKVRSVSLKPNAQGDSFVLERLLLKPGEVLRLELPGDALLLDNRVDLPVRPPAPFLVAWVGRAVNPFVEKALLSAPGVRVVRVNDFQEAARVHANLTIVEDHPPAHWPTAGASWWLGAWPTGTKAKWLKGGLLLNNPRPLSALAEDLSFRGVSIGQLAVPVLPAYFTAALTEGNAPLLYTGQTQRARMVVFPFSLWDTDMVLSVGFPILIGRLLRETRAELEQQVPPVAALGQPLALPVGEGRWQARLVDEKGTRVFSLVAADGVVRLPPPQQPGVLSLTQDKKKFVTGLALLNQEQADLSPGRWRFAALAQPTSGGLKETFAGRDLFGFLLAALVAVMALEWLAYHRLKRVI